MRPIRNNGRRRTGPPRRLSEQPVSSCPILAPVPAPQRHRLLVGNGGPLDRSSFVPLYYQLQEVLKEQIESGVWGTGEALPSEPELARRFGVSRVVVRQALAILEDDRQIVRVKGRGPASEPAPAHGWLTRTQHELPWSRLPRRSQWNCTFTRPRLSV